MRVEIISKIMKGLNNKIEATGIKLGGFSEAGCSCASFRAF